MEARKSENNGYSSDLCSAEKGYARFAPKFANEVVYADENFQVKKLWSWAASSLVMDEETNLLVAHVQDDTENQSEKTMVASLDGKLAAVFPFDAVDPFQNGFARVFRKGNGYGFIDKNMQLVVPPQYDEAKPFRGGHAIVRRGERWGCVDAAGQEKMFSPSADGSPYLEVVCFSDGLCGVSTMQFDELWPAYYSDNAELSGLWGFVDESGNVAIEPQYIYANDFEGGIAIVAKGRWVIEPRANHPDSRGRYWAEDEVWGGIDKNGDAVIPFAFDEIKRFYDCDDVYIAHVGGWKEGHWGILDRAGKWQAPPIFDEIGYEYSDGMFTFYGDEIDERMESALGIYDCKQQKVLLEPQFYDVEFFEDGNIAVEVFDPEMNRNVTKVIDRNGNERFQSVYSFIYEMENFYQVSIRSEESTKDGVIDKAGNVIVPCIYHMPLYGFFCECERFVFEQNGKQGLRDLHGNIVIPAVYYKLYRPDASPLLTAVAGDENHHKEGVITLDGRQVLPTAYSCITRCSDGVHFFCRVDGGYEMYSVERNGKQ
jgi:hypothetical protein